MQNKNLPPLTEEQIEAALEAVSVGRGYLSTRCPFLGHLVLRLEPVITRRVPLAGVTRDRKLLINPEWAVSTTRAEMVATIAHEVLHLALLCFERQGDRKAIGVDASGQMISLWNVAHDYVINEIIHDFAQQNAAILSPTEWKPAGLYDVKYLGWSAEEVYDAIYEEVSKKPPVSMPGQPGQPGESDDDPSKQSQPSQQGQTGEPGETGLDLSHLGTLPADDIDDSEDTGQGASEDMADDAYWGCAIVEASIVHEQSNQKGSLPGQIQKIVQDLTSPEVDWRERLSRYLGENGIRADFTWSRPNRRSESVGEFLPSLKKSGVPDVCILIDTSGSMGTREQTIISEAFGIIEDLELTVWVVCCDTRVTFNAEFVSSPDEIELKGGGGSDFRPAFKLFDEFEGVIVAFTDGYITVPSEAPPHAQGVLWCLWGRRDMDPTRGRWGEVLYIKEDG